MTDYIEEQKSELEVLQSIYPEEIKVLNEDPITYKIFLSLDDGFGAPEYEEEEDIDQLVASLFLQITYPPTYPDVLPEISISASDACGFDDKDINSLTEELTTLGEESLGMAMVFTLSSQLKDSAIALIAFKAEQRELEAERRLMRSIQADDSKFIGTKVTVENFLDWKARFDIEMDNLKAAGNKTGFRKVDSSRLTGRQLFEKDSKLAQSDMKYLEEGDEDIDTTQFERLRLSDRLNPGEESNNDNSNDVLDLLRGDHD